MWSLLLTYAEQDDGVDHHGDGQVKGDDGDAPHVVVQADEDGGDTAGGLEHQAHHEYDGHIGHDVCAMPGQQQWQPALCELLLLADLYLDLDLGETTGVVLVLGKLGSWGNVMVLGETVAFCLFAFVTLLLGKLGSVVGKTVVNLGETFLGSLGNFVLPPAAAPRPCSGWRCTKAPFTSSS